MAKSQLHAVHGGQDTPKLSAVSQVAGAGGHLNVGTTPPPLEGTDAMADLEPLVNSVGTTTPHLEGTDAMAHLEPPVPHRFLT